MFQLTINEKGGATRHESFEKDEVTIGRVQGNDIILPKGNISKRHSRIVLKDGKFIIVDLKSTNGTYVNGKKITAPQVIKTSDKVYIGDFTIQIEDGAVNGAEESAAARGALSGAEEEIDLFGGDAGFDAEPAPAEAPGLIDDNFDQEFEPAPAGASARSPGPSAEPELELDEDFSVPEPDAEPPALDLDAGFDEEPDPAPLPRAPSLAAPRAPSAALEPDLEATPPPDSVSGSHAFDDSPHEDVAWGSHEDADAARGPRADAARGPHADAARGPHADAARGPHDDAARGPHADAARGPHDDAARGPHDDALSHHVHDAARRPHEDAARRPHGDALSAQPALLSPSEAPPTVMPARAPSARGAPAPNGPLGAPQALPATAFAAAPPYAAPAEPPLEREALLGLLHAHVLSALDLAGTPLEDLPGRSGEVEDAARARLAGLAGRLPAGVEAETIAAEVARRAVGIEAIADLIADDSVFEVVLGADRRVLVDREGRLEPSDRSVASDGEVLGAIHALAALGGAEPGALGPLVDVRLRSGARVMAALPPLAFRGPSLTVRKTTRDFFTLEKLQEYDTIDGAVLGLLEQAARFRKNVLLSIGPGVTATATLNALLSQAASDERIVTVERGVELHLRGHDNAVSFDMQPGVDVKDVLQYAAGAQTERVFFGELAEAEAAPVVEAFGGALEGGAAAIVAPSAESAFAKLVAWVGTHRAGGEAEARRAVARAFPLVLQERKLSDNSRRLTEVAELVSDDEGVRLEPIFRFEATGVDESMMITGRFVPAGRVPRFLEELAERGEAEVDASVYEA